MGSKLAGADIALTAGVLVTGKTGSGKTSTAKRLIEDVCGYRDIGWQPGVTLMPRVCILDPIKSDWWGITLAADGRRPALPFVILGGPHGHVPLSDTAGTAIGELVASGQLPLSIIDMAYFKMGGLQRFYCDFAEALFRNNKHPLHLVLEEAHEFAPKERTGAGGENMAVYWSKKLATAGRSKGLRLMLATQAAQSLHNSLMGSCETLIAHRMTLPAHIEPITEWLKAHLLKSDVDGVRSNMPKLSNGQAFIVHEGDVERRQFKLMQTFDNTKTPDGSEIHAAPPPIDRSKLLEIVGAAVKDAEENDVATLKARIKELETARAKDPQWDRGEVHQAGYEKGFAEGKAVGVRAGQAVLMDLRDRLKNEINQLFGAGAAPTIGKTESRPSPTPAALPSAPRAVVKRADTARGGGAGAGEACGRRVLAVLQKYPSFDFSWDEAFAVAGIVPGNGYAYGGMKYLRDHNHVTEINGHVQPNGYASHTENAPSRREIVATWSKLKQPAPLILEQLMRSKHGEEFVEIVAAQAGVKPGNGYWYGGVKALRNAGLIEEGTRDKLKLSNLMMRSNP